MRLRDVELGDVGAYVRMRWVPAVTNGPSNGVCRSVGFRFAGEQDLMYAGQVMRTSHWVIDPRADLT